MLKKVWFWVITLCVITSVAVFFFIESMKDNNTTQEEANSPNTEEVSKPEEEQVPEYYWGVDSASFTTQELVQCVQTNYGNPTVWGRYLEEKENVSAGLTLEEANYLHGLGIKILPIFNHFTEALSYDVGVNEANQAIFYATELGIPEGVAIFADTEPSYPVDSEFSKGWYDTIKESSYLPGIYGVFDLESELVVAYQQAASENSQIMAEMILWTAYPQEGTTSETNAPTFAPQGPEGSLLWGWQYGIDGEACNIDTNWFTVDLYNVLW